MTGDYIRLKMTLEKGGVAMNWETFDGESKTMAERAWLVSHGYRAGAGIDADSLLVEAFDLELDSHFLIVNGKKAIPIPITGSLQTKTYRFRL